MKAILSKGFAVVVAAVRKYPNGTGLLLSLGTLFGARFGFNLTAGELAAVYGAVSAAVAAYVHTTTVPAHQLVGIVR